MFGEIRMFARQLRGPPAGCFCEGALLAISEFETLFNLIGTHLWRATAKPRFALARFARPASDSLRPTAFQMAEDRRRGGDHGWTVSQIPAH